MSASQSACTCSSASSYAIIVPMGHITSLFVRKVVAAADDSLDKIAELASVGIDADSPVDPTQMIPDGDYYDLLERLAREDPTGTTLPLRAGASMRCDDYGALGLAWKSAPTLRGSYDRAVRYARVLTNVASYELEATTEGAFLNLHRSGERQLGMRLSNEATLASITQISREALTKVFNPVAVFLKHPVPENIEAHETFFQCPLHFEADRDALLVSSDALEAANQLGDGSISRFFDHHLDVAVASLTEEATIDREVRDYISRSLSEGVPTISDVARTFGMSDRTLQRRLSDVGQSFQALVDDTRRELASRLVRHTQYTLTEVAFMTGFSEQSAFTRAFRRWEGQTPRSFRLQPR